MNIRSGEFGNINIRTGSEVELRFTLKYSNPNAAGEYPNFRPRELSWTFLDLDTNGLGNDDGGDGAEEVMVRDAVSYFTLSQESNDPNPDLHDELFMDNGMVFRVTALKRGFECDNPKSVHDLKVVTCNGNIVDQMKRAATFNFQNRFDYTVKLKAHRTRRNSEGRNFLFYCKYLFVHGDDC